MPVFFISPEQHQGGEIRISGPLWEHLRKSLRVRSGAQLWLGDEEKRRYLVQVIDEARGEFRARILEEHTAPVRTSPTIVLGCAILKGERMDWVIQKATELGVDRIVPLETRYTVVQVRPERVVCQQDRWQRIAREAAQQAERWDIPHVEPPVAGTVFFERQVPGSVNVVLSEREAGPRLATVALPENGNGTVMLAIGPEGGWADNERHAARAGGFAGVSLGNRILRAETAVVAALSVIQSRVGEL